MCLFLVFIFISNNMPKNYDISEQEINSIQLRSDEVQDILTHIPHWLIRWGTTLIALVIALIIFLSYLVKYPDVMVGQIEITTQVPPNSVMARSSGKIVQLSIKDQETVEVDDWLCVINSTANMNTVKEYKQWLTQIATTNLDALKKTPSFNDLGALQATFARLKTAITTYNNYKDVGRVNKTRQHIEQQIDDIFTLNAQLTKRRPLLERNVSLLESNVKRHQQLLRDNTVPALKLEEAEQEYLQARLALDNLTNQLQENQVQVSRLEASITENTLNDIDQKNTLRLQIIETIANAQSEVADWELQYIVKAPIAGTVSMPPHIVVQERIKAGEELLTIVPEVNDDIIGKLYIPLQGAGKVKPQQQVNIKLHDYPHHEFGILIGHITQIDLIPRDKVYTVQVNIPLPLTTNYKKQIGFKQQMRGTAEVITEDLRLIERIFNQFKSLFKTSLA